jgi:ribonuclease HI
VLDTIRYYGQLQMVIYTDGSAVSGVRRGGSSALVTSGDPSNPTFLDARHQCGPEYTTSLEVEMWGLWLAIDCLDDEAVAAGVLIYSDSHWALNALKID